MSIRNFRFVGTCLLAVWPAVTSAQTPTQNDELQKQLNSFNETQRAILKELQEIRKVLQQQQAAAARPAGPPPDVLPTEPTDIARQPFRGAANAKVAIIEFSDYQCPFCARFEKDAYPQILKEYVDTGKVKYVWRDLPLDMHQHAQKAAEAGNCAGDQGKFWEMHDLMFENQKALAPADLTKHAATLQLNEGLFQACLDSSRYAAEIKSDVAEAGKFAITGTPSFLIGVVQPNGSVKVVKKLVGTKPFAEFKAAIDSALAPAAAGTR